MMITLLGHTSTLNFFGNRHRLLSPRAPAMSPGKSIAFQGPSKFGGQEAQSPHWVIMSDGK